MATPRHSPAKSDLEPVANSLFESIGADKVRRLVGAFYARVDKDPVLRPMYGKTLSCAISGLTSFLTFWLGGPPVYDLHRARLRRRHAPFTIDARARDIWLTHMKAAAEEVELAVADVRLLMAHLTFGAHALVNSGTRPGKMLFPVADQRFDPRLTELWNRMSDVEEIFDALSDGDLARLGALLPKRLVPHAELMSHALARSLDSLGRVGRRHGRRSQHVKPLEVVEFLLARRDLDLGPDEGDAQARFRHLQAMIEAYAGVSALGEAALPLHARVRAATRDRFLAEIERDHSSVRLLGSRGQTLLHDAALAGAGELAAALIGAGADPDAKELGGHTPLYRAATGMVARVLVDAGATVDARSGPTRGTPLHQAARRGNVSVAGVLLDHGADIEARDCKGETPLRRAVNCRQLELVQLFVQRGADAHARDKRGVTPLQAARAPDMKETLASPRQ